MTIVSHPKIRKIEFEHEPLESDAHSHGLTMKAPGGIYCLKVWFYGCDYPVRKTFANAGILFPPVEKLPEIIKEIVDGKWDEKFKKTAAA